MRFPISAVALMTSVLAAESALACSCAPPSSPQTMIDATDHIFRAQIVSGSLSSTGFAANVTAVVNVLETFKGDASGAEVISTALQSATCGVPITLGSQTVYFASERPDGSFSVNLCSQLPYDSDRTGFDAALDALPSQPLPVFRIDRPIVIDRPIRLVPMPPE